MTMDRNTFFIAAACIAALCGGLYLWNNAGHRPSAQTGLIITASELRAKTLAELPNCAAKLELADATYNMPVHDWLTGEFSQYYQQDAKDKGLTAYRANGRDCDKFSGLFMVDAQCCFDRAAPDAQGIAVGQMHYIRDDGVGHSINIVYTDHLEYLDPQSCAYEKLSAAERLSCRWVSW